MFVRAITLMGFLMALQGCAVSPVPTQSSAPPSQSSDRTEAPTTGETDTASSKFANPNKAIADAYAACIAAYEGTDAKIVRRKLELNGFVRSSAWGNYSIAIGSGKNFLGFSVDHTLAVNINPSDLLSSYKGCRVVASDGSTYGLKLATGLLLAFTKEGYMARLKSKGRYQVAKEDISGIAAITVYTGNRRHETEMIFLR